MDKFLNDQLVQVYKDYYYGLPALYCQGNPKLFRFVLLRRHMMEDLVKPDNVDA